MSKEIKDKVVPKLRFPEFREKEGWTNTTLETICSSIASGKDKIDIKGKYDLYGSTGIIGKTTEYSYNGDFILVARVGANAGFLARTKGRFGVTDNTIIISLHDSEKTDFVYYILKKSQLNKLVFGSGQPLITSGHLKNLSVDIPKPNEQKKIADCLSSLDELITAHSQKLEALKAHKKGLMQQLFPAEGETVPKLRFAEFEDSGEWKEKTLGEIAEIKRGAASQHLNYVSDNLNSIRLLRINDFLSNTPVYVEDTEEMKRYRVRTNDLLIAGTGATAGITFKVPEKFNNLAYSYNAPRIRILKEDSHFIYTYLKTDFIIEQQKKMFVGNAQPFLDTKAIANFRMIIPMLAEQQKIAACLSSLDELITSQAEKIESLKIHKKGLMQQLFPNTQDTSE